MKKILSDYWLGIVFIVFSLLAWKCGMEWMGDNAAIVGPDLIVRRALGLFSIGLSLAVTMLIVRFFFPSIWAYTDPLDFDNKRESMFEYSWVYDRDDPRLWQCIIVYLSVFYSCLQAFSL